MIELVVRKSDDFLSNREWLSSAVKGENLILRKVSALEYMQLFVGYFSEQNIEVYSLKKGNMKILIIVLLIPLRQ